MDAKERKKPERKKPPATPSQWHVENLSGALDVGSLSEDVIVREFQECLAHNPTISVAVAAIQTLTSVIKKSSALTMMGLQVELAAAADSLKACNKSAISLAAGCELFNRYVTRASSDNPNYQECKSRIIERGEWFSNESLKYRKQIAHLADRFIRTEKVLMLHGYSRVVNACCLYAAEQGKAFDVVVTEGRPDFSGLRTAKELVKAGIPVTVILDSAVGFYMEKVDLVLLGAEGVVENGGIINKIGSYQIAVVAKVFNKPVYVAAESYKFARMFPLNQDDVAGKVHINTDPTLAVNLPLVDYTPPEFITLLFTDLGVLTPSAVSDELIKLYY